MSDIGTQTSPLPEPGTAGRDSFEWERLQIDPEEICKARFRHLLEKNSFMKGDASISLFIESRAFRHQRREPRNGGCSLVSG